MGKITTTQAKAKEVQPKIEKFITRAKNPTLADRRILAAAFLPHVVKIIINCAAQAGERKGGYTRIIKLNRRPGDAAYMAILELVT